MKNIIAFFYSIYFRLLCVLVSIPAQHAHAQLGDSLILSIPSDLGIRQQIDTLNALGFDLIFSDPHEARVVLNRALALEGELAYLAGRAKALKSKAISYDIQGNSNQAIVYYLESISILQGLNDSLGISRLKNNLGIAYKNLGDLETAQKFYEESIAMKKLLGDRKGVAYGLNNIGELLERQKAYHEALEFFSKSYAIVDSLDDNRGRANTLSNLATSYLEIGEYDKAIDFIKQAMVIDRKAADLYDLSYSHVLLAKAYLNTNRAAKGLLEIEKAENLSKEINALKVYYESQLLKARLLRSLGQTASLPDLYEYILELNDSLMTVNLVDETALLKTRYESREKEMMIEELQRKSVLNEQLLATQNLLFKQSVAVVIIMVVLLIIVFILYRKVRGKQKDLELKVVERNQAKEEAEYANKAKSQFLAQMSHEIRTPLNAIIGYTDQVMETKLDSTQKKHLMTVYQSGLGLMEIINEILDLSKLEEGKLDLLKDHTDLKEMCEHVIQMSSYEAKRKGIDISLNLVDDESRYILADDTRLRQVLVNLMANAVKFTKEGKVDLKVETLGQDDHGQQKYKFSVHDTGIGIKPENLERIFQAFRQEDVSTTRKYGGTGLGLSISNAIVTMMGGQLHVESTPGVGSTFYFEVGFDLAEKRESKEIDQPQLNQESRPDSKFVSANSKLKILVADDNPTNMLLVKMMLKKAVPNASIIKAANGLEAVQSYKEENPDIILMDVQMPEMDGYSASKKIRSLETNERVPIIAITAGSMKDEIQKCFDAGMDDFIGKPIVKDALSKALRKWITDLD